MSGIRQVFLGQKNLTLLSWSAQEGAAKRVQGAERIHRNTFFIKALTYSAVFPEGEKSYARCPKIASVISRFVEGGTVQYAYFRGENRVSYKFEALQGRDSKESGNHRESFCRECRD